MPTIEAADVAADFGVVHEILMNERKNSVQYMNKVLDELR